MSLAAVAAGVLSLYGGSALADSRAQGAGQASAGVLSGDGTQDPANPVDDCGDPVDAATAPNPSSADSCATTTAHDRPDQGAGRPAEEPAGPGNGGSGGPGHDGSDDSGRGRAENPGHAGTDGSGHGASKDPGYGGSTDSGSPGQPPTLPHTGGARPAMIATSAASAALIAAGVILYRRGRSASRR